MSWVLDVKCPKCGNIKWTYLKNDEVVCLSCGAIYNPDVLKERRD